MLLNKFNVHASFIAVVQLLCEIVCSASVNKDVYINNSQASRRVSSVMYIAAAVVRTHLRSLLHLNRCQDDVKFAHTATTHRPIVERVGGTTS